MKNALYAAGAIALLALSAVLGTVAWVAGQVPAQLVGIRGDVNTHLAFARAEASAQLEKTRAEILSLSERQLSAGQSGILARVDTAIAAVDARVGESLGIVDRRTGDALAKVDGIVTIAADLRSELSPTLAHLGSITGQLDAQAPLYLDCEYNPDCLMNRYQGASKAFERAMQHTAAAMSFAPRLSEQFAGIATDAHTFTSKFTAPRTKKQKIWDGIKTGAFLGVRLIP